jgi:hypothetical protein
MLFDRNATRPNALDGVVFLSMVGLFFLQGACPVFGQESIKPSMTGAAAASMRATDALPGNYNLRLGPVTVDASAGLHVEYYDNVALSDEGEASDMVIRPEVHFMCFWQVTRYNALNVDIGLSYAKYLNDSSLDTSGLLVSPNSQIGFDIFAGDFRINLHDRFSVLQNPIDEIGISNAARFQRVQNAIGISVLWDLNDVTVAFGYDHFDFWAVDSEFDYLNRSEEQVFGSVSLQVMDALAVGLDASGSYFAYEEDVQNDGWSYSVGPFMEAKVSNYLAVRASGGYQVMQFETGGGNLDSSDVGSGYGEVTLSHRLNRRITHSLGIGYENRLGLNANAVGDFYTRYRANWEMNRKLSLSVEALYEDAEETDTQLGAEHSRRFAAGLGINYKLGRKVNVSANYRYAIKDSNLPHRDYQQNVISADIRYDF